MGLRVQFVGGVNRPPPPARRQSTSCAVPASSRKANPPGAELICRRLLSLWGVVEQSPRWCVRRRYPVASDVVAGEGARAEEGEPALRGGVGGKGGLKGAVRRAG